MTVSVIIPNYNHASYLRQRIESILSQSFQDFELILLDDCSTDESREIMESYRNNPHVSHIVCNTENSGSAFRQWERGITLVQGDWIWIAESDDWAEPSFLDTLLANARRHPECGLLFSLPRYIYPDGSTWNDTADGTVIAHRGTDFARSRMACHNAIHNASSTLMRRSAVQQVDLTACAAMRLCGDWMLYAQLCAVTDVLEVRQTLSNYRIHTSNVSSQTEREGLPLIEGIGVLDYMQRRFALKPWQYARAWGRTWAKLERQHRYSPELRSAICHLMHKQPAIRLWHLIYRLRLCQH